IGSIYTIVIIFDELRFFSSMCFEFVMAYIIVLISLGRKRKITALKAGGIYIINALILSGLCYYFSQKELGYSFIKGTTINNFSSKYIIISAMIIYIFVERVCMYLREKNLFSNFIFNIEININNIIYVARAFLDTGNELREPVTNLPCILVEEDVFANLEIPEDKLFYINYSAIGYNGKLKGFKVNDIKIYEDSNRFREVDAIVCLCKEVLSREREFNALLSRGVI
ncbi:MAG: sigma-E processing peptidase SpoIIGA, partial [Clostridium sp.]|nr:sigma-E processing peptidase SpoIIGA [Clostridium sp.]